MTDKAKLSVEQLERMLVPCHHQARGIDFINHCVPCQQRPLAIALLTIRDDHTTLTEKYAALVEAVDTALVAARSGAISLRGSLAPLVGLRQESEGDSGQ